MRIGKNERTLYYFVTLANPGERTEAGTKLPEVWATKAVKSHDVPVKNGPEGSTEVEHWIAWVNGGDGTKRGELAKARELAERDGAPLLVEEDRSVTRRRDKATMETAS